MPKKISDFFKSIPKQNKDNSSNDSNVIEQNANNKENMCISKSPIIKTKLNEKNLNKPFEVNSPSTTDQSTIKPGKDSAISESPKLKDKIQLDVNENNLNKMCIDSDPIITAKSIDASDKESANSELPTLKDTCLLSVNENEKKTIECDSDNDINYKPRKRLRQITSDSEEELDHLSVRKRAKKTNRKETINSPANLKSKFSAKVSSPNPAKTLLSKFHNKSLSNMEKNEESSNSVQNDDDLDDGNSNLMHLTLDFLKPEKRRDKKGRLASHPDYDETSLQVPDQFMEKLTPGMKQWWQIKSNGNMDKILFFKVGKFYETYHMDAVICVKEINLTFMRGNYAHSGFPEIAFTKMTDQLVLKGYKVGRVEQTESVELMLERVKSSNIPSKNRVVNREVCQVVTPGTRTFSLQTEVSKKTSSTLTSDDTVSTATLNVATSASDYRIDLLMAIKEKQIQSIGDPSNHFSVEIGIAFVDSSTGKFTLTQFKDDKHRSKLKTVLTIFTPSEMIYERGNLSRSTLFVFNTTLSSVHKEGLIAKKQFYSSSQTLTHLLEDDYFSDTPSSKLSSQYHLPSGLIGCLNVTSDNLGRTASDQHDLSVSSLGGLLYYLKKCMIDKYLVSFGEFGIFSLNQAIVNVQQSSRNDFYKFQKYMILDSMTMDNLDLLRNHSTGTSEGTLLERLDFTQTAFGRRLLIQWISSPLCDPNEIKLRQDAIQDIIMIDSQFSYIRSWLNSLPDLEKLLAKIHSVGVYKSIKNHPNTRAVMYENAIYSKRQISDFIAALDGFRLVQKIQSTFINDFVQSNSLISSELIKKLILLEDDGSFPDLTEPLTFFENAFNMEIAKSEGRIIPEKGVDSEFDVAINRIAELDREKKSYLDKQCKLFKCTVNYFGTAKNAYQLEIPEGKANTSKLTSEYTPSSQRKGYKRYQTAETQRLLTESLAAEEQKNIALKSVQCRVFGKFDQFHTLWRKAVDIIAQLDVLQAMAVFSKGLEGCSTTRPIIEPCFSGKSTHLSIEEGRYPCRAKTDNDDFIPNSVKLGDPEDNSTDFKTVMLLTGPNMGGKSTLMKQVALTVVLAQMGCFVPAEGSVTLSPVDRLLTRQGANDNLNLGLSTLQVELTETSHILANMTRHSLVLVDELGRGTATHDGCALARSILYKIGHSYPNSNPPRTIFSTHFHRLLEERELIDMVQIAHMACVVEDDDEDDENIINNCDENEETKLQNITLLYKLTKGGCPKSYGFNAAKLANLPDKVILHGLKKARIFEEETLIKDFERLLSSSSLSIVTMKSFQENLRKVLLK